VFVLARIVVKTLTQENVTAEELGGDLPHSIKKWGHSFFFCLPMISMYPTHQTNLAPSAIIAEKYAAKYDYEIQGDEDPQSIWTPISENPNHPYDIRDAINGIC